VGGVSAMRHSKCATYTAEVTSPWRYRLCCVCGGTFSHSWQPAQHCLASL